MTFLLVAIHSGPYNVLKSLEIDLGTDKVTYLVAAEIAEQEKESTSVHFNLIEVERNWGSLEKFVAFINPTAVIRGCSDAIESVVNIESKVAQICLTQDIPVFAIEDFPGNYWPTQDERLDGLFVEEKALLPIYESRGMDRDVIHVVRNPRYDFVKKINFNSARAYMRDRLKLGESPTILWTGQPDGDNSYQTLERVLESYRNYNVNLLFRAHPRDPLYLSGNYSGLNGANGINIIDVTTEDNLTGLYCASDLVATQFSSTAVEASHLGVPAVYILFDDLGKRNLKRLKGYCVPVWARNDSSFIIKHEEELASIMEEALFDSARRKQVLDNFHRRFGSDTNNSTQVVNMIKTYIKSGLE